MCLPAVFQNHVKSMTNISTWWDLIPSTNMRGQPGWKNLQSWCCAFNHLVDGLGALTSWHYPDVLPVFIATQREPHKGEESQKRNTRRIAVQPECVDYSVAMHKTTSGKSRVYWQHVVTNDEWSWTRRSYFRASLRERWTRCNTPWAVAQILKGSNRNCIWNVFVGSWFNLGKNLDLGGNMQDYFVVDLRFLVQIL